MKKYEGMFLVDQDVANKKWDEVTGHIRSLLEKHKAEILDLDKWNDLKLAYPIKKRKKATYILGHFNMDPLSIAPLRTDMQMSETLLRYLITLDTGRRQFLVEETPETKAADERSKETKEGQTEPVTEAASKEEQTEPVAEEASKEKQPEPDAEEASKKEQSEPKPEELKEEQPEEPVAEAAQDSAEGEEKVSG